MQIWIYQNGIQQGPYTLPQLQMMNLDPSTPVWYNGLGDWTPAAQAPATASLFGPTAAPPGFGGGQQTNGNAPYGAQNQGNIPLKPPTYLVWNILLTVLCCCPLALIGIITGAISSSRYGSGDYAGAQRMSTITEWLLILSVVWMLIAAPVAFVLNLF